MAIAAFFGDQGWLTVSEKSFVQYIQAFKRTYPEALSGGDIDGEGKHDLNNYVTPLQPSLDEEVQLEQLIRVQKTRLAIGLSFEKQTNMLNKEIHKDVNTTLDLVKTLAQMRGKMVGAGRPTADSHHPMSNEAKEALRKTDQSEQQQERVVGLMGRFADLLQKKQKQDAQA